MRTLRWLTVLCGVLICGALVHRGALRSGLAAEAPESTALSEAERARHFDAHIAPLLARHCLECHDSTIKKGRLDLSRRDEVFAERAGMRTIAPGNPAESLLWDYVEAGEMPPKERPPLSDEEKQLLREWIEAGAVWSGDQIDLSALSRDGRAVENWIQRLTVPEYIETVRGAVGVDVEEDARRILPPDLRADGFSNTAYNLSVDLGHIEAYAQLAELVVGRMDVPAFAAQYADCRELADDCMRRLISKMGKWLLRGPLEEHEIKAFLRVPNAVAAEGGDFTEAVSYLIEAMLQSPRFIYRIETQRGDGTPQPAGPYELASRLSYVLWGSPPDSELMRAADAGELSERRHVEAQVRRMLDSPRAVERSSRFIYEWLNLGSLQTLRPNPERFPMWNERLAADMRDETLAFFNEIVWEQKRPMSELMNAQVTFATPRLADFYGLDRNLGTATSHERPHTIVPERVTAGLQALYTFEEGSGDTVRDQSGADEPIHLKIANTSAVTWTGQGLAINSPTLIAGDGKASLRLSEVLGASGELTVEAWVTPATATQAGPARIVTFSKDTGSRHFTLGQDGQQFETRLRTSETSGNGVPGLGSMSATEQKLPPRDRRNTFPGNHSAPVHVVYTRDSSGNSVFYINGLESNRARIGGNFSNWLSYDTGFRLALANELSNDRPWLGTLHLAAVYSRALSTDEVRQNRAAGHRRNGKEPLLALYRFDEGTGGTVRDTAKAGEPLDLKIEDTSAVQWSEHGLTVNRSTLITTAKPAGRLTDAIRGSGEVTLEAWVTPANTSQAGPARILTLSSGHSQRNFTLGQDGSRYEVRFRSVRTDGNGLPGLSTPDASVEAHRAHVVYTRRADGEARLYLNGEEQAVRMDHPNLSNWSDGFQFMLANESSKDRPWQGTFHSVAIYSRALTPEEVQGKFEGEGMARYDVASVPSRGGLLTHAGVLTVGGDEASMVARGLFILHDILHSAVGSAPPCVDTTPVPAEAGLSRRAVAEARVADPSCSSCHARFEPLAFGLEKFDGIGAFHEIDEHGNILREDGEILFPGSDKPIPYQTSAELMDLLAESDRVRRTLTRKLTQFALGRPLVESDSRIIDNIHEAAHEGGGTYASLITTIILSDLVQMTRTEINQ